MPNSISTIIGNSSKYQDFYKYYLLLKVSQYIDEFPIIEELELFFQSWYSEFTIIEDPLRIPSGARICVCVYIYEVAQRNVKRSDMKDLFDI